MSNTNTGLTRWNDRDRLSPELAKPPQLLLRIALGIGGAISAGSLALIALLIGGKLTTGCFFSCNDDANPLVGIPVLVAAAALATVGLGALWWAFVDGYWRIARKTLGIAGSIGAVALVATALTST